MTAMQKMKSRGMVPKAVLYARFSSDNQREESIEAQLRAMHEYCQHSGAVVIREYCDRAKSATTDDRPEFLSMVADAKNHEFDFVVVHKLDRFSRNRYDSAYYKRELRKNGVSLLSVLEHMDDSPESVILESVLEGMSEYYSKNLAREVMKGMRETALKCQALGGRPPFGYKVNPETRRYEVNEEEADAVRLIFRQVCEGHGYSEIITELNRLGYKTRNGNPFGKNSITEILRNEKYKGIYIFNRAVSYSHNRTRNNHQSKPEDEIIRIPGGMPALVDEKTFDRVAAIIKGRSRSAPNSRAKETYLLAGKVFCGVCKSSYNGNRQFAGRNKSLLVTYRCAKYNNHGDLRCRNKAVYRDYIEDFILKRIGEIVFAEERIPGLIAAYYESHEELAGDRVKILDRLYGNRNEIQRKIDNGELKK
ncbi:MAG: recombinase family protein [Oscillospiraceae bacterium]|nr:recombinase family protein [Oscillospiraceae bacterium]MDD4414818.1 recombinase family protein [Oscillospiraceae bacterium]